MNGAASPLSPLRHEEGKRRIDPVAQPTIWVPSLSGAEREGGRGVPVSRNAGDQM